MYATVPISVEAQKALAIPKGSAVRLGDKTFVFVQRGDAPDGACGSRAVPVSIDEGEDGQWLPVRRARPAGTRSCTSGTVLLSGMMAPAT